YHDMYGPEHVLTAVRSEDERGAGAHPVLKSFMDARMSQAFARDDVRERVIPAYMGLIKQIDDSLGRLFDWMEKTGRMDDTMIVMSSDHGDYLGDHWLGDKEHFHDCSTKIPLIVYDPRAGADATRGQAEDRLVELIDLAPTFLDFFGGEARPQNLEGRSLTPLLSGAGPDAPWRRFAVSELDYGFREVVHDLDVDADEARMTMIRDERWKYIHVLGFPPQLFDLGEDPDELKDRGRDDSAEIRAVLDRFAVAHQAWASSYTRPTYSRAELDKRNLDDSEAVLIGFWDEADFEARFGKPFVKTDGRY
ncbi:MAG: sulfatase-like hydrolase/transferase, partial [Alphaproteobacteria bacterium]